MITALVLAAVLPNPSPEPDAKQIYVRAKAVVNATTVPRYIVFTYQDATRQEISGHVSFTRERLKVVVRNDDGHAFVRTLRTLTGYEGRVDPVVVGDNGIFPNTNVYRLGAFPMSTFGLRDGTSSPDFLGVDSTPEPHVPQQALRTIGTVTAIDIPYNVRRLADEQIGGRAMYHLRLTPVREPRHNVLREMWVDEETFQPCRYVAERFVGTPSLFSYFVTVDTAMLNGVLVNIALTGHFSAPVVGHPGPAGTIEPMPRERFVDVSWSISDISFPEALPTWLFDPQAFAFHKNDTLPASLEGPGIVPPLTSLRTLVFGFAIESHHISSGAALGNSCNLPSDGNLVSSEGDTSASIEDPAEQGRIYLDVVAAPTDGSLAVDVRDSPNHSSTFTRVGVSANGQLSYDPRSQLTIQEQSLLWLMGRTVIGPAKRQLGAPWEIPDVLLGEKLGISLRIGEMAPTHGELVCLNSISQTGVEFDHPSVWGKVIYNPELSVPVSAVILRLGKNGADTQTATETTINLTLLSDSFQ